MADTIKFQCKGCGKKIGVRAEYAGKKAKCPGCQQPIRVPSPRPKRATASGAPVASAAAGASGLGDLSGDSSAGPSLYDLAEMEQQAPAEMAEMTSRLGGRAGIAQLKDGKPCPACNTAVKQEAIICVHCGHNFESGKKLKTKKDSKMGKAMRNVATSLGEEDDDDTSDLWKYAIPTFSFLLGSIAAYTGLIEVVGDSVPIKFVQNLVEMYESMGGMVAGTIMLVMGAVSGLIWFLMKR